MEKCGLSPFSKPFHHGICLADTEFAGMAEVVTCQFGFAGKNKCQCTVVVGFRKVGTLDDGFAKGIDSAVVGFHLQVGVAQVVPKEGLMLVFR